MSWAIIRMVTEKSRLARYGRRRDSPDFSSGGSSDGGDEPPIRSKWLFFLVLALFLLGRFWWAGRPEAFKTKILIAAHTESKVINWWWDVRLTKTQTMYFSKPIAVFNRAINANVFSMILKIFQIGTRKRLITMSIAHLNGLTRNWTIVGIKKRLPVFAVPYVMPSERHLAFAIYQRSHECVQNNRIGENVAAVLKKDLHADWMTGLQLEQFNRVPIFVAKTDICSFADVQCFSRVLIGDNHRAPLSISEPRISEDTDQGQDFDSEASFVEGVLLFCGGFFILAIGWQYFSFDSGRHRDLAIFAVMIGGAMIFVAVAMF